ncbi:hypothetical protein AMS68_007961 [Peltaster fructicola]|uniref:GED domain-containing protein n=1 Tax=Peltaster fructicola TaxID=286661 RepID=A0A6H0Y5Z6_9PEZI|nr:hypothetical protein AMS68_007961 [Peltaster fructicola]
MAPVDLQSREHRDLIDIIDNLRLHGVNKYVDLPEIIVCGDQSSGKSSVLEAVSRISFPAKDNLCTRFPTELILRRDAVTSLKLGIIPATDRSHEERDRLSSLQLDVNNETLDMAAAVEAAKHAMGISEAKVFSKDVLRVELSGPTQPNLTIVDIPGIFRAGSVEQSIEDANTVKEMVREYMSRPRSIILAVVSAKSDFSLQDITELAKELDPDGSRTLGIITKPDTLDAGSDSERFFVELAQNKNVVLRLGWHVLVNRSFKTRDNTSDQRDRNEARFLSSGAWSQLADRLKGVTSLLSRLSIVSRDQILQHLPELLSDVEEGVTECYAIRKRLGSSRETPEEHRRYLLQISQDFSALMRSAADGIYTTEFFGNAMTDIGYKKRLRAVVQNSLSSFAEEMRLRGQQRIVDSDEVDVSQRGHVSRKTYVNEVKILMTRSRGRELPGTFSPMLVGELFAAQCKPWEGIARGVSQDILAAVHCTIKLILEYVAVDDTAREILAVVHKGVARCKEMLDAKITELLHPHLHGHPITYNHYLTDNVQKAQSSRQRKQFERSFMKVLDLTDLKAEHHCHMTTPSKILDQLQQKTEVNMERYASELAVDYMEAYYKVAMKKFVDDVSTLAIEECLMRELSRLFDPQIVFMLKEEELLQLTSESRDTRDERVRCSEKLTALESARTELRRLDRYRPEMSRNGVRSEQSEEDDVVATGIDNDNANLLAETSTSNAHAKEPRPEIAAMADAGPPTGEDHDIFGFVTDTKPPKRKKKATPTFAVRDDEI